MEGGTGQSSQERKSQRVRDTPKKGRCVTLEVGVQELEQIKDEEKLPVLRVRRIPVRQ